MIKEFEHEIQSVVVPPLQEEHTLLQLVQVLLFTYYTAVQVNIEVHVSASLQAAHDEPYHP